MTLHHGLKQSPDATKPKPTCAPFPGAPGHTLGTAVRQVASEGQLATLACRRFRSKPAAQVAAAQPLPWHPPTWCVAPYADPSPDTKEQQEMGGPAAAVSALLAWRPLTGRGKGGAKPRQAGRPMVCLPRPQSPHPTPSTTGAMPCSRLSCRCCPVMAWTWTTTWRHPPPSATCSSGTPQPKLHPAGTHGAQPRQGHASWLQPAHQLLCAGQEGPGHGACLLDA